VSVAKGTPTKPIGTALAIEEELHRLGGVAMELLGPRLDSRGNLDRADEKLAELGSAGERLQPLAKNLLDAPKQLVDSHQASAEALAWRAGKSRPRREVSVQLMGRYAKLRRTSRDLNCLVLSSAGKPADDGMSARADSLWVVERTVAELIESARGVPRAAEREDFGDCQADSIRQPLLPGHDELNLLTTRRAQFGTLQ